MLIGTIYSFQKLNQYSQGNNALDVKLLKFISFLGEIRF
jgi:hypothetical protein